MNFIKSKLSDDHWGYSVFKILALAFVLITVSACGNKQLALNQQKANAVQTDNVNLQSFAVSFLNSLQSSSANNILSIKAHPGKPIVIDAASFDINQPIDLEAIFNSPIFRRDWGALFPQTTNGFDAFIRVVDGLVKVASRDTPWLASALNSAIKRAGTTFTGNGNNVATDRSSIDNSNNSDNSQTGIQTLPIDTSVTPVSLGAPPEPEEETPTEDDPGTETGETDTDAIGTESTDTESTDTESEV